MPEKEWLGPPRLGEPLFLPWRCVFTCAASLASQISGMWLARPSLT